MEPENARSHLSATRFADLRWVAETGSTNAELAAAARAGAGPCALVADHQTAGRGRLDRRWEAAPGASLLMSVLVPEPFPAGSPHLVATALGVAAHDAVADLAGVAVGLKWPNDLVAPGAGPNGEDLKLGGLLAELVSPPGERASVVVGIGINVDWPDGFPPELAATSTAVNLLGGRVDRGELVVAVLGRLDALLAGTGAGDGGGADLMDAYRQRCVTVGRRVRAELAGTELVGVATGIADDGALVVTDDGGTVHTVAVGDVVHLRPAGA